MILETAMAAAEERRASGPFAYPTAFAGEHEGMTLRDWFAGRAMQGSMLGLAEHLLRDADHAELVINNRAKLSYVVADAMLRERDRK